MKKFAWKLLGLLALLPAVSAASYEVQLGCFSQPGHAQRMAGNMINLGYGRVASEKSAKGADVVVVGPFETYAEAHAATVYLRKNSFPDAFVVKDSTSSSPAANATLAESLPNPIRSTQSSRAAAVDTTNDSRRVAVWSTITAGRRDEAATQLLALDASTASDDPIKGWVSLKLAYLAISRGERGVSKMYFERVANKGVCASPQEQAEALLRLAYVAHGEKDRPEALRLFGIVAGAADDPEIRAEATVNMGGIIMELARSGKGTLEESRQWLTARAQSMKEPYPHHSARLALMAGETYYHEKNFVASIAAMDRLLVEYPQAPMLEKATANLFLGLCYFKLKDSVNGEKHLATILTMPLGEKDRWATSPDMKVRALGWLIELHARDENVAARDYYIGILKDQYPEEWRKRSGQS